MGMDYRDYFKGKKVTVMGLDALGRGLADARFLAELKVDVIATDQRPAEDLEEALALAERFDNITLVLGEHRKQDFEGRDIVIRPARTDPESEYLETARKGGALVVTDETLFLLCAPKVVRVGVTGTRGKTTVTMLIYEIMKRAGRATLLGGNIQGAALLPRLPQVKEDDVVIMELDSWKLQSFAERKMSPHVAVFTTFYPDHLNYYNGEKGMENYWRDKTAIFNNQKRGDVLVVSHQVESMLESYGDKPKSTVVLARGSELPKDWTVKLIGEHNRSNAALAAAAAHEIGASIEVIRETLATFTGVPHRLQLVLSYEGIDYYNDTTATTPEATIAALRALTPLHRGSTPVERKRIVLIVGGTNKGLDYKELPPVIGETCKGVVLFKETGTALIEEGVRALAGIMVREGDGIKDCLDRAQEIASEGDIILLSPAFASFGKHFKNEYDRGEQFMKAVEELSVR